MNCVFNIVKIQTVQMVIILKVTLFPIHCRMSPLPRGSHFQFPVSLRYLICGQIGIEKNCFKSPFHRNLISKCLYSYYIRCFSVWGHICSAEIFRLGVRHNISKTQSQEQDFESRHNKSDRDVIMFIKLFIEKSGENSVSAIISKTWVWYQLDINN